jgi:hypothetical protein
MANRCEIDRPPVATFGATSLRRVKPWVCTHGYTLPPLRGYDDRYKNG